MTDRPAVAVWVLKADVLEHEPVADRAGDAHGARLRGDRRLHLEEHEQILEVQTLLVDVAGREQEALDEVAAACERRREKGQRAERDRTRRGADEDRDVRAVVAERPDEREQGADDPLPDAEPPVLLVVALGERGVSVGEPAGEPEHLHLFRRLVARPDIAQVVELAALGCTAEEQGVRQRREVRLADEAGQDGEREQEQQPRVVQHQRGAEGAERDDVLPHREEHRDQPDARRRLPARALEVVVEVRVLELLEIQRRRVAHEAHADVVREQIPQQRLDQRRGAREQLSCDDDRQLERHDPPQVGERCPRSSRQQHDLIDDQLRGPQRGDRHERSHEPEHDHRRRERAMRLPDESHELREISERLEALAHVARPLDFGNRRARVDHAGGHGHQINLIREHGGSCRSTNRAYRLYEGRRYACTAALSGGEWGVGGDCGTRSLPTPDSPPVMVSRAGKWRRALGRRGCHRRFAPAPRCRLAAR